jgi:hypothetical protein
MKPMNIIHKLNESDDLSSENEILVTDKGNHEIIYKCSIDHLVQGSNKQDWRIEWSLEAIMVKSSEDGEWIDAEVLGEDSKYQWVNQYILQEGFYQAAESYGFEKITKIPSLRKEEK